MLTGKQSRHCVCVEQDSTTELNPARSYSTPTLVVFALSRELPRCGRSRIIKNLILFYLIQNSGTTPTTKEKYRRLRREEKAGRHRTVAKGS